MPDLRRDDVRRFMGQMTMPVAAVIRGRCDRSVWLIAADEPLAALQRACGGDLPGPLVVPGLLALVRQVVRSQLPLTCKLVAHDGSHGITARASASPDGESVVLDLVDWGLADDAGEGPALDGQNALARHLAEGHMLLDAAQQVLVAHLSAPDLDHFSHVLGSHPGRRWTDFVELMGCEAPQASAVHWRLLDQALLTIPGSPRPWRVHLALRAGGGFEAWLVPETITALPAGAVSTSQPAALPVTDLPPLLEGIGRELAPVLRQPVDRIIALAATIQGRLAGPLPEMYATYAGDIAEAGRHLLGLIDDFADFDAPESPAFRPAPGQIDLADCARRAVAILGARAHERGITLALPDPAGPVPAIGELRRVLQILLNLLTNAIRYTTADTTVRLECGIDGDQAWIAVVDTGAGLTADQAARVFNKFERLGRQGDGGSGLGLYLSRRLARAMGGDLAVFTAVGQGCRFELSLPADRAAIALRDAVG